MRYNYECQQCVPVQMFFARIINNFESVIWVWHFLTHNFIDAMTESGSIWGLHAGTFSLYTVLVGILTMFFVRRIKSRDDVGAAVDHFAGWRNVCRSKSLGVMRFERKKITTKNKSRLNFSSSKIVIFFNLYFVIGGRALPWPVVAGSLMLTNLSTEQLVGLNGRRKQVPKTVFGHSERRTLRKFFYAI